MKRESKQLIAVLLCLCLLLPLWGCGGDGNIETDPTETKGTVATQETEATEDTKATDTTDATEVTEPTEATEVTEETEATEATEITEATELPTEAPTEVPTEAPTEVPTEPPTQPTEPPTQPTEAPTEPTEAPTQPTAPPPPPATAQEAIDLLKDTYRDTGSSTPADFDRYGILFVGNTLFGVQWSTNASTEALTIRVNPDKTVTVDINDAFYEGTNYALTATVWDSYGNSASYTWSYTIPVKPSGLKTEGKVCATFGDSITWYDGQVYNAGKEKGRTAYGYQQHMKKQLRFSKIVNYGYSGAPMPYVVQEIMKKITDPAVWQGLDYITIMAGANDERWGTPVGTLQPKGSNFDTTTYIGALQSGIEYALSKNPNLQIVLFTPIKGWIYAPKGYVASNPQTQDGIITEQWGNAVKEVARLYGLPVCDLYNDSGIDYDIADRVAYMNDPEPPENEYYSLHPNTAGFKLMGDAIVRTFKAIN